MAPQGVGDTAYPLPHGAGGNPRIGGEAAEGALRLVLFQPEKFVVPFRVFIPHEQQDVVGKPVGGRQRLGRGGLLFRPEQKEMLLVGVAVTALAAQAHGFTFLVHAEKIRLETFDRDV